MRFRCQVTPCRNGSKSVGFLDAADHGSLERLFAAGLAKQDQTVLPALDDVTARLRRPRGLRRNHGQEEPGRHTDLRLEPRHRLRAMLAGLRRIGQHDRQMRAGAWDRVTALHTPRLAGKTVGLIGFGDVQSISF